MNKKDKDVLARIVCNELSARGYKRVTIKDMRLHIDCIMNSIHEFGQWRDNRPAYDPIIATRYYKDNGAAYLAAQDIIFDEPRIKIMHAAAARNRRGLMIEAGEWSEAHEYEFVNYWANR